MKLFFLFYFLLIFNSLFSQTNADSIIIINKVKEVRVFDMNNKLVNKSKYDSIGQLVFSLNDDFGGSMSLKTTLTKIYDENGNNIISVFTHSSFDEPTIWREEFDKNNNRILVIDEFGDYVFKFFYDKKGFMTKKLAYDENNEIRRISLFVQSDNGKKIIERIGRDSIFSRTNTTFFDDNGNFIRSESMDGEQINSIINSSYENNRLIKTTYHGGYWKNYYYDSEDKLIEIKSFKSEQQIKVLIDFDEFIYNTQGLIEKYRNTKCLKNNELYEYRYEYEFYD